MSERLAALHASAARLLGLSHSLDDAALSTRAYPAEWTVGDVFSHLGSAADIFSHLFDDVVHDRDRVDNMHQLVWDEWNAKPPTAQVTESLAADAGLIERFDTLDDERRQSFRLSLGPIEFDFEGLVGTRLNEHALHTWDIDVAFDPAAVVPARVAGLVADNLRLVARYAAKPDGAPRSVRVRTGDPARDLVVEVGPETCDMTSGFEGAPDLELPTESFVRLVYGRLDPAHTPVGVGGDVLDGLRRVFRGV
jgi:uncharacterized protein (TIGR03083 family)